jgi:serine/threonine protein kinase
MDKSDRITYNKYLNKIHRMNLKNIKKINIDKNLERKICQKKIIYDISNIKNAIENRDKLYIDNVLFIKEKEIAKGAYGRVFSYKNENNEYICVKKSLKGKKSDLESDIKIINYMKSKNICETSYVKSYIVSDYLIIMEYMDGNLKNSLNIQPLQKIEIFKELVKHIYCLERYDLYYTDIKLINTLYRCNNDGTIEIYLGDIGSIEKFDNFVNDYDAVSSYPPPEHNRGFITKYDKNVTWVKLFKKSIVWSLGINFLLLFNINEYKYLWDNLEYKKMINIKPLQETIIDIPNDIEYVKKILYSQNDNITYRNYIDNLILHITKALAIDPNERIYLNKIYEFLFAKELEELILLKPFNL